MHPSAVWLTSPQLPCRWKWFFYINPLSWTLYGIIVTQLGDQENLISTGGGSLPALESGAWCLRQSHSRQGWHLPTANKHWLCIMFCGTGLHVASCRKHGLQGKDDLKHSLVCAFVVTSFHHMCSWAA